MSSSSAAAVIAAPCPTCRRPLHISTELHGCVIACHACRDLTAVIAERQIKQLERDNDFYTGGPTAGVTVPCPSCNNELRLTTSLDGRFIRCRACTHVMGVVVLSESLEFREATTQPTPVPCPRCAHTLVLRPSLLGNRIQCRGCRVLLQVTGDSAQLTLAEANALSPSRPGTARRGTWTALAKNGAGLLQRVGHHLRNVRTRLVPGITRKPVAEPAPERPVERASPPAASPNPPAVATGVPQPAAAIGGNGAAAKSTSAALGELAPTAAAAPATPAPKARLQLSDLIQIGDLTEIWVALAVTAVAVGLLAGITGIGWWWYTRPPAISAGRYLPLDSQLVTSIRWSELVAQGLSQVNKDQLEGKLVSRALHFFQSAGLKDRDIDRVTAGGSADESNPVVVYYLSRPIEPEDIADRDQFRSYRRTKSASEWVRGSPVYHIEDRAIAFPDPQVIVNGTIEQVREVLRRGSGRFRGPLAALLPAADFEATCTRVSSTDKVTFCDDLLPKADRPLDGVIGTMGSCKYGTTISVTHTVLFTSPEQARAAHSALETRLRQAITNLRGKSSPLRVLEPARFTTEDKVLRVELQAPRAQLTPDRQAILVQLFR